MLIALGGEQDLFVCGQFAALRLLDAHQKSSVAETLQGLEPERFRLHLFCL